MIAKEMLYLFREMKFKYLRENSQNCILVYFVRIFSNLIF